MRFLKFLKFHAGTDPGDLACVVDKSTNSRCNCFIALVGYMAVEGETVRVGIVASYAFLLRAVERRIWRR